MGDTRIQVPGYISAAAGASAGLIAGVVVCPLDVVKTRLQVQGMRRMEPGTVRRGVVGTFTHILREEGVRGLYSGLVPLCVGYLPSWAIYFYVYKSVQRMFPPDTQKITESKSSPEKGTGSPQTSWGPVNSWGPAISSSLVAGACSTMATNPIWMIKTRLMAQSKSTSWRYSGMIDAARSIYTQEGWRAFYSGLGSALLGLPHVAIHFPLYERLKRTWAPQKQWYGILGASIVSKVIASTITYPHEVVRSRNQIKSEGDKYRGVWRTVRTLWIEEGWRAFYAGLGANVCRAVPASAVTLLTFEVVSGMLAQSYYDRAARKNTALDAALDKALEMHSSPPLASPSTPLIDLMANEDN